MKTTLKRIIISTAVIAAVGAAAVLCTGFFISNTAYKSYDIDLLTELKPGKYLIEKNDGLDENDYIEVFTDGTLQFVGREMFWEIDDEECNWNEKTPYKLNELVPAVNLKTTNTKTNEELYITGIGYKDENTFEVTLAVEGNEDVVDYTSQDLLDYDPEDEIVYGKKSIIAHFQYVG